MNAVISALLNSLWPAAAVAATAWAILRFSPKMNAATRYAVWWAVLAAVIALPVAQPLMQRTRRETFTRQFTVRTAPAPPFVGPVAQPSDAPSRLRVSPGALPVIVPALWLAAFLFQFVRIV